MRNYYFRKGVKSGGSGTEYDNRWYFVHAQIILWKSWRFNRRL